MAKSSEQTTSATQLGAIARSQNSAPPTTAFRNRDLTVNHLVAGSIPALLDEINERTPFIIDSYSYIEYTSAKTKLKLAAKPSDLDLVVRQLQWLGLQQGKLIAREAAAHAITAFLAQGPASSSAPTCTRLQ